MAASSTTTEVAGPPAIDDEELTAQALAAGHEPADAGAVCFWDVVEPERKGLLPDWYMPVPGAGSRRLVGWRRAVALSVIGTFVAINGYGLCSTYGFGS